MAWEAISRDPARLASYLDTHVFGVADRQAYLAQYPGIDARLRASERVCAGVNYGY